MEMKHCPHVRLLLCTDVFFIISSAQKSQHHAVCAKRRIGTPFCVTYDFESEDDGAVTVRDRDSMEQERIKIEALNAYFIT